MMPVEKSEAYRKALFVIQLLKFWRYVILNNPYYFIKMRMFKLGYIDSVRNFEVNSFDE